MVLVSYSLMLQATGQGRGAMIMALAQGLIIIPVLFVLDKYFGLTGVVWSLLVAETICSLLAMFIVYLSRNQLTVDKKCINRSRVVKWNLGHDS